MNITIKKLPHCMASVHIEMPGDTRVAEREKILRKYVQNATLPGFRKGKAPRNVVEKRFAADIEREVAERLVKDGIQAAVKQENLKLLAVGDVEPDAEADEGLFAFSVNVTLAPVVPLPNYKGLHITVPKMEVTEEMVDRALQAQREKMANLLPVDRPVKMGDFLTISYAGIFEGIPLKDQLPEAEGFIAGNSDYMVKAEEESFLPGFCRQLEGMNAGETRGVTLTMPAEGVNGLIAGKEVSYTVTLSDVKEAELPVLNDEFAARLVPGKTLEEVRAIIRESAGAQMQQKDLEQKRVAAMMALREKVEFDIPESVVHNATQQRVDQLVKMNLERGITQDTLQENEQEIVNAAWEQAKVDVKDEFILQEVVAKEELEVTRDDIARRIGNIAHTSNTTPDKVIKTLNQNDGMRNLKHSILLGKALDVLVEHAIVHHEGTVARLSMEPT